MTENIWQMLSVLFYIVITSETFAKVFFKILAQLRTNRTWLHAK